MGDFAVADGYCPSAWAMFQNKCYFQAPVKYSHNSCLAYCASLTPAARLPCIESAEENANILATDYLWIGYNDVASEGNFVWPALCPSTYVNFASSEPNGGTAANYVVMNYAGRWLDTYETLSAVCKCEIYALPKPTTSPTPSPTLNPTFTVTLAPTRPTRQPTFSPTYQSFDCRAACSFLNTGSTETIVKNKIINSLTLSTNFYLSFDVIIPSLADAGQVWNIFDLKDTASNNAHLKIGITATNNLHVNYNNIVYITAGAQLESDFANVFTRVYFQYFSGTLMLWTSVTPNTNLVTGVTNERDLTLAPSVVMISSPADTSSGGTIKNFVFAASTPVPTATPTCAPTAQPTIAPSALPSSQPSARPTGQPSAQPSRQPSRQPSSQPSSVPTRRPSSRPSAQPSAQPTARPTLQPFARPSSQPTSQPSAQPTRLPTARPSVAPSAQPTGKPSKQPSAQPTSTPSSKPSSQPTRAPSMQPSTWPTGQPSAQPTTQPSVQPSEFPSSQPSAQPSSQPICQPSEIPTQQPSGQPTLQPSAQPLGCPSSQPSAQPSAIPSSQPNSVPSCKPHSAPSALPSTQPTGMPTNQPTCAPSTQPSTQPSVQPSSRPSLQPISRPTSKPSRQPSVHPSTQPSSQPSHRPSAQPSRQPTRQPSSQPSRQPSGQPSRQPSRQPTSQPTSAPTTTGEWTTQAINGSSLLTALSYINGSVWACGGVGEGGDSVHPASCTLANAVTGELSTEYRFPWDTITTAIVANDHNRVMISGRTTRDDVVSSAVANCSLSTAHLVCVVMSFCSVNIVDVSYNAYSQKIVYVGRNTDRATALLFDSRNATVKNLIYTNPTMVSVSLSHVICPPNFVGSFVAGTSVGSSAAAAKYIFAGWLRTDTGQMAAAIGIAPVSGIIVSTTDLVTAMALEATGPDSFVAGGLQLTDGAGVHAYLVRANALYKTAQYGVRYRPNGSHGRRVLSTSSVTHGVARGLALTKTALFMIVDTTSSLSNRTSLSVLKINSADGTILTQAHVSSANKGLHCTDITVAGVYLSIACTVQRNGVTPQSLLITVNQDLSFIQLPSGFRRHGYEIFLAESVPIRAVTLSMTSTLATVARSDSTITTSVQAPSRRPSTAPSARPSASQTSVPSVQPSSRPSSSPSVSARPTSHPSTAGPTNTRKPTFGVTMRPTESPSVVPSAGPSTSPNPGPNAPSTVVPSSASSSARPSESPSMSASSVPSVRPTRAPTARPSTRAPSALPTVVEVSDQAESQSDDSTAFVIGASVGGAVCFALCGLYVLYRSRVGKKLKIAADKSLLTRPISQNLASNLRHSLSQRDGRDGELDSGCASFNASAGSNSAGGSSASRSSSYNISSLHSSERSLQELGDIQHIVHSCASVEEVRRVYLESEDLYSLSSDSESDIDSSGDSSGGSGELSEPNSTGE